MSFALIMAELPSLLKDEECFRCWMSFELRDVAVLLAEERLLANSSLVSPLGSPPSSNSSRARWLYSLMMRRAR